MGLGVTVLCLALSAWLVSAPAPMPEGDFEPPMLAEAPPAAEPAPPPPRRQAARSEAQVPPVARQEPATRPEPQEAAPTTQGADDSRPKEGLGLYRPGTKPLKQGIIVPEDFELPPGYVRHYQSTDNGQMQRPILMFHPDYKPVDENGQPVELPSNRVVPPELAPPGMPIDVLELPGGPEGVEPIP